MQNSTTARKYDVIVWGATGFTGRLVCEYLTLHYSFGAAAVKWAVGGRNREKLTKLVGGLENKWASPPDTLVTLSGLELLLTYSQTDFVASCSRSLCVVCT
jgi:short subunit dehydrogenase-like uncharacterized protein